MAIADQLALILDRAAKSKARSSSASVDQWQDEIGAAVATITAALAAAPPSPGPDGAWPASIDLWADEIRGDAQAIYNLSSDPVIEAACDRIHLVTAELMRAGVVTQPGGAWIDRRSRDRRTVAASDQTNPGRRVGPQRKQA